MKKRSAEILQNLLENPNKELEYQHLIKKYHISEKTLKVDIQEIADFTREAGCSALLDNDNQRLKFTDHQSVRNLIDQFYSMDSYQYKLSPDERKVYIILALVYHNGYYSMQQLADELYVTRNTIINDCKLVDEYLKTKDIVFVAKSKKGIKIQIEEEEIQRILVELFEELIHSIKNEKTFFVHYIIRKAGFIYSLKDVIYHMNIFSGEHNIILAKEIFFEIAICIFVLANRLQQIGYGKQSTESRLPSLELDTIGNMISYVIDELGYQTLGYSGILIIEKQILLRNLHPQIQSINDFELYSVISHFLLEISRELDVMLQSDNLLIESLISHVKSMKNWNDAGYEWSIDYKNTGDFPKVRKVAECNFYILEKYLQYALTPKMKDSLVIHICAALLRGRKNSKSLGVIISCPGSMATSKYLEAQVKNYFNFYVVGTMTTKQIEKAKGAFDGVDFIISTVPIRESRLPVVVVKPLVTVEDIQKIQNQAYLLQKESLPEKKVRYPVLEKIITIYESGNNPKIDFLNRELQQILEDCFYVESKIGTEFILLNMLDTKYIKIVEEELEWRTAMRTASADLIKDGFFDESYIQEAIGNVEEYGGYIIVNQGIALAHASKEAGVYEDGIGLLVSKKGIRFDDGDPVHLLFVFSQKGETEYLDLFKQIIKLGKNQEDIEDICRLTYCGDVYRKIWEILSRE
ncbi:MAG: PTS sugar transporter subunit IIA [Hespellia sp.]|nr:PTS sugar transporter subunit IIA [Hespellia sp.]